VLWVVDYTLEEDQNANCREENDKDKAIDETIPSNGDASSSPDPKVQK
jgi:hypothetical protein